MARDTIEVTVTFPLAAKPFHGDFDGSASILTVRNAAMKGLGADEEAGSVFYLSHKDQRVPDERLLRDIADHAQGLKFRLVKELIQG